ncbi:MAG: AP endonuclease [Euryarchaeota archaeon]|nr:AP endonuclease [Euryarchaeota archaeon]
MVRVNVVERVPDEEEVGLTPMDVESDLIIEMLRQVKKKNTIITNVNDKIKADDTLITLASGLVQNFKELKGLGTMGKELDVELTMHTPYYMDLTSGNELTKKSIDSIRWAGLLTNHMEGSMVVSHIGLYGDPQKMSKKQAYKVIKENIEGVMAFWSKNKIKAKLGFETSGRQEVFGSLEELIQLSDEIDGIVPVLNFAHLHARQNGTLREPQDFGELFDRLKTYVGGHYYTHFAGVEHEGGNEKRVTPIKKGDLRFEPLAEYLADENPECTIISSSPLLEHDAMYMKVIYERVMTKKVCKDTKAGKKDKSKSRDDDDDYYDDDKDVD